jgi:hypothetical protein
MASYQASGPAKAGGGSGSGGGSGRASATPPGAVVTEPLPGELLQYAEIGEVVVHDDPPMMWGRMLSYDSGSNGSFRPAGPVVSLGAGHLVAGMPEPLVGRSSTSKACCDDCTQRGAIPCGSGSADPYATAVAVYGRARVPGPDDGNFPITPIQNYRAKGDPIHRRRGPTGSPMPTGNPCIDTPDLCWTRQPAACDGCAAIGGVCWEVDVGVDMMGNVVQAAWCSPPGGTQGDPTDVWLAWAAARCALDARAISSPLDDRAIPDPRNPHAFRDPLEVTEGALQRYFSAPGGEQAHLAGRLLEKFWAQRVRPARDVCRCKNLEPFNPTLAAMNLEDCLCVYQNPGMRRHPC